MSSAARLARARLPAARARCACPLRARTCPLRRRRVRGSAARSLRVTKFCLGGRRFCHGRAQAGIKTHAAVWGGCFGTHGKRGVARWLAGDGGGGTGVCEASCRWTDRAKGSSGEQRIGDDHDRLLACRRPLRRVPPLAVLPLAAAGPRARVQAADAFAHAVERPAAHQQLQPPQGRRAGARAGVATVMMLRVLLLLLLLLLLRARSLVCCLPDCWPSSDSAAAALPAALPAAPRRPPPPPPAAPSATRAACPRAGRRARTGMAAAAAAAAARRRGGWHAPRPAAPRGRARPPTGAAPGPATAPTPAPPPPCWARPPPPSSRAACAP